MIKLLCLFPILCASISIATHSSVSPTVSVNAQPRKYIKQILTSTATVGKTTKNIDTTPIENLNKLYLINKTDILLNISDLPNNTNVLPNKTIVLPNNTNVLPDKITHHKENKPIKKQSYLVTILKICIFVFVILIIINLYYKLKKIKKPMKNQYLPLNVVDSRPVIHVSRTEFNPYNRDNEQCYKRLSGNNSPV
jgi:hypothetical protein